MELARLRRKVAELELEREISYEFGEALRASGVMASTGRVGSAFDKRDGRVGVRHPEDRTDLPPLLAHRRELEMDSWSFSD